MVHLKNFLGSISFTDLIIPLLVASVMVFGLVKGVDVFALFLEGAKENLKTAVGILPALVALMLAIGMFKSSGALDVLTAALTPLLTKLNFPSKCLPLALIRPISGSGALAVYENLLKNVHPDSFAGRVASVMMGSTETTFYTLAVYFSATKITSTRHALLCALAGDMAGFIGSALLVRLWMGQ